MHITARLLWFVRNSWSIPKARFSTLPKDVIVFADDGTAVCWHPEQTFPYEFSKSLPETKVVSKSVLKIGEADVASVFQKQKPEQVVQELANLTYTTKHRWYPRSRDNRAKKTPMDRPYL
ncbi:39S ribosomal protein L42, mitochondrial [Cephus cinctus]|uniref:Large ribosomal subunit protein mL42 n=1 Tax=Cephus cinctus TaxID=211228 RepID=A0AAJ7W354_CEPCN|nr:39S ribosomal protein L42, mitochondrial [Cephus cinctus]XP_024942231.1 39S ribosomal protein L42, mitochondrial [Cephus cinctus]XP_024942232.1 39S ribosomal protein L42, mitochondrial [Cephus cinctus]XP_024942235.1 39S ribosomal protein L42, mitochondrial [Cephus cinctus]